MMTKLVAELERDTATMLLRMPRVDRQTLRSVTVGNVKPPVSPDRMTVNLQQLLQVLPRW